MYASICHFHRLDRRSPAICPFFLDVGAERNLDEARNQTLRACNLFVERLGMDPDSIDLHFSGAEGFHLILPQQVFGKPTDTGLIRLWQCLAPRLTREGLTHIDLEVYQATRPLRLPNSVNSRTMLYKVPLEYKELRDLELSDIIEIAKAPREHDSMAIPAESHRAVAWLAKAREWLKHQPLPLRYDHHRVQAGGWRTPPCIRRIESTVLPDGMCHPTYYVVARFYATTSMAEEEAIDRLRENDRRHPIRDPDYVERVVHNGWAHPGFSGCPNPILEPYCDKPACYLKRLPQPVSKPPRPEKGS